MGLGGCGRPGVARTWRTFPGCRSSSGQWVAPSLPRTGRRTGRRCSSPSRWAATARSSPPAQTDEHWEPAPGRSDAIRLSAGGAGGDVLHQLFDRWVQNLRRCAGFVVQYFGAIEPQRRLAPHIHLAIRGAIPRHVSGRSPTPLTCSCGGPPSTSPSTSTPSPVWDPDAHYRDPDTGDALPTWEEALDDLDARPGRRSRRTWSGSAAQVDIKGIMPQPGRRPGRATSPST